MRYIINKRYKMEEWDYLNQQLRLFPGITIETMAENFQKHYSKGTKTWTTKEIIKLVELINTHRNTFHDIGIIIEANNKLYKSSDIDKNTDIGSNTLIFRINELEKENDRLRFQINQNNNTSDNEYTMSSSI